MLHEQNVGIHKSTKLGFNVWSQLRLDTKRMIFEANKLQTSKTISYNLVFLGKKLFLGSARLKKKTGEKKKKKNGGKTLNKLKVR